MRSERRYTTWVKCIVEGEDSSGETLVGHVVRG